MKRFLLIISVLLLAWLMFGADAIPQNNHRDGENSKTQVDEGYRGPLFEGPYRVLYVVDGDTLSVSIEGKDTRVRLIGIDTPEVKGPNTNEECFGEESSLFVKTLLEGEKVRLLFDDTQDRYDKYDRLLAYVFLEENVSVNEELIRQGYAGEFTFKIPYDYQKEFKEAEVQAKKDMVGMWQEGVCE